MASIYERSSGTFYANFHHDGRRTRFSLRTKDRREALRKIEELEEAYDAGKFDPAEDDPFGYDAQDGAPPLSQAFQLYAEEKRKQGRKESTLKSYRSSWRMLRDAVGKEVTLDALTAEEIEDFIHDREIALSTRAKRWRHIRCVLNYFDRSGLVETVAAPQRPDSLPTPMRRDDLSALTEALKKDYRAKRRNSRVQPGQMIWAVPVFRFVFYTGLRASEVASLRWKDVDTDAGVIRLRTQKNGTKNATVPLVSKAEEALRHAPQSRESNAYVFRSLTGPKFERSEEKFAHLISKRFRKAREKCDGVPNNRVFHDLRAGFATHLASNGLGAHEIRSAMRHADVSTSMKYVRVANSDLRSSMEQAFM
jgi:integrase